MNDATSIVVAAQADDAQESDHRAQDEMFLDTKQRERDEKKDARLRSALNDPKRCRSAYRDIADAHTPLTHAQFRVLSYLLRKADADLSNAFPSQQSAATALAMKRSTYNWHLVALRAAGWIRTHEFSHGGRQSSSGIQFCIPAGVLPLGEPWLGVVRFDREYGTEKRPRRRTITAMQVRQPVVG